MLTIQFHNDSTGDEIEGNYDVRVYINYTCIYEGRVEKHNRLSGWEGLINLFAKQVKKARKKALEHGVFL